MAIIPHKTPIYNDKNQHIGFVLNENASDTPFYHLFHPLPAKVIDVTYKPIYSGGKIIGVKQELFLAE